VTVFSEKRNNIGPRHTRPHALMAAQITSDSVVGGLLYYYNRNWNSISVIVEILSKKSIKIMRDIRIDTYYNCSGNNIQLYFISILIVEYAIF